jgi:CBS domain containing-hemolysin-like protein
VNYLFFSLLSIAIQGFFAFFEMACVSFNKVRLQYYTSIGTKRAIWLNYLLQRPSRLFGTTLIGITASLVIGSECSRRFYESLSLDPDWAPFTQIPLVVIFGELAPMFAARRYPEQSAIALVPLMIFLAKLFTPITWTFDILSKSIYRSMGKETPLFLSREEVRMAFEEKEGSQDEFNEAVGQIFQLRNFKAGQLMLPLSKVQMVPSTAQLSEVRHTLSVHYTPLLPIYHKTPQNIVGVVQLKDLIFLEEGKKILEVAHSPWFVTGETHVLQLLQQFRRNNQSLAVILDSMGQAIGILTLDQILSQIFGEELLQDKDQVTHFIDRTLSGEMSVAEFNEKFEADLPDEGQTLSELLLAQLGHPPARGESIAIGDLEFTIETPTLRGIKTFSVKNR